MLKKIVCAICLTAIVMTLTACNSSREPSENTAESKTTQAQTQKPITAAEKTESTVTSAAEAHTLPPSADPADFETEAIDGGIKITKYIGSSNAVNIPEEIDGSKVTVIGKHTFAGCSDVTEIIIPNTVAVIEQGAFARTGLEKITIPDSVTEIHEYAFQACRSIEEIYISKGVKKIEDKAFQGCRQLKSVEVDPLNENFYSVDGVLFGKELNLLIKYPASKSDTSYAVPEGVEKIASDALAYCNNLTELTLPQSLKEIQSKAIIHSSTLIKVTIPDSAAPIIFDDSFYGCERIKSIVYKGKTYTYEEIGALIEALS